MYASRCVGLHAVWPKLSVLCNSFGDFPVLPPCFVSLFFVLVKVSEILDIGQILLSVCFVSRTVQY